MWAFWFITTCNLWVLLLVVILGTKGANDHRRLGVIQVVDQPASNINSIHPMTMLLEGLCAAMRCNLHVETAANAPIVVRMPNDRASPMQHEIAEYTSSVND